jgi:hypothetical protein
LPDESIFIHVGEGSKTQRRKKSNLEIPLKIILIGLGLFFVLFSAITYGLWVLTADVSQERLRIFLLILIFKLPILFAFGYWFGSKEVRGFLSGADAAMDKIAKAVDIRDGAKVTVHQRLHAPQQPASPRVYTPHSAVDDRFQNIPSLPKLTFRESGDNQIIDL